jgi:hypothetical protein
MSELVKTQQNKPAKKRTPKALPTEVAEVPEIQSEEGTLSDVAIMAADAEFATAVQAYDNRYAENLKRFGLHVRNRQKQVVSGFKEQIQKSYGIDEAAIYGDD